MANLGQSRSVVGFPAHKGGQWDSDSIDDRPQLGRTQDESGGYRADNTETSAATVNLGLTVEPQLKQII